MVRSFAAAALTAALVLPATADAKTFRGKTSQGRSASVVTGAGGVPTRVRVSYRTRCDKGSGVTGSTVFLPPFDQVTADALTDGGTENVKSTTRAGESARITSHLSARRHGSRWSGTYRITLVIKYKGRTEKTCKARGITWRAQ